MNIFIWLGTRLKMSHMSPLKTTSHSQRRRDFTNDVESQLETILVDNVFSDTPVGTTTANELFLRIA